MIRENTLLSYNIDEDFQAAINKAAELYHSGGVFVYPTDTIYGFGGNPYSSETLRRISRIKGRDDEKQFIFLVSDFEKLLDYVDIQSERHFDFLRSIYPNPISVVLRLNSKARRELGIPTAAFRIPNHRFCKSLLQVINAPLISTSVNRSGQPPLNEKDLIIYEFRDDVDALFYSGKKAMISASTVIELTETEPRLLREGYIKFRDLMDKYGA